MARAVWRVDHGCAVLDVHGQDRSLRLPGPGVYGVFDGVGQFASSGRAAAAAAAAVTAAHPASLAAEPATGAVARLRRALETAHAEIVRRRWGATTAVVLRLLPGELAYAAVGDSRLYLRAGRARLRQVTVDEGEGNRLDNWLGEGLAAARVEQAAVVPLTAPATIVLVSDGITGDWPGERLGPVELEAALDGHAAQDGAERLVAAARKHDDRTAVVVRLEPVP